MAILNLFAVWKMRLPKASNPSQTSYWGYNWDYIELMLLNMVEIHPIIKRKYLILMVLLRGVEPPTY